MVIDHLLSKEWAHDNVEGGENRTVPALTEEEGCVVSSVLLDHGVRGKLTADLVRIATTGSTVISRNPSMDHHADFEIECIYDLHSYRPFLSI